MKPYLEMNRSIPTMKDFPIICIQANEQDNKYPPLGWESQASKVLAQRYL